MARIVSNPLNLFVQAAPRLGSGSDPGRFANDLWTPGRDASGMVNLSSLNLVPAGRWVEVADTRLDALDAVVKAAVPGWNDYGSSRWNAVTHAWNGVAIDEAGGRAWWICCGGHADGSNNGIYRFDGFKMKYDVEHMPSDTRLWSNGYKLLQVAIGFSACPESSSAMADRGTQLSPINDWFYDEVFWDSPAAPANGSVQPVGSPTARHVYSGVVYSPQTNELIMAVRRLWRYSLADGRWTYKRLPNDTPDSNFGEEVIAVLDQTRQEIIVGAVGSGGPYGGTFNLTTRTWTGYSPPWASWNYGGGGDCRFGDFVTVIREPEDPAAGPYSSPGQYLLYNVTTRQTTATGRLVLSGGLSQSDFVAAQDGCGLVYIPPLNRYWLVPKMKATGQIGWMEVDPTTAPWTLRPLAPMGAVPSLSGTNTLIRRRMVWMPGLNAVVWLGSADKNISIYRF